VPTRSPRSVARTLLGAAVRVAALGFMPLALAGCLAFQDVELSTEREGASSTNSCTAAQEGTLFCAKKVLAQCLDGTWTQQAVCPRECLNGQGCVDCKPKTRRCDGSVIYECNELGADVVVDDCSTAGQICNQDTLMCGSCARTGEAHCNGDKLQSCNNMGTFNEKECFGKVTCVAVDGLKDHCAECQTVGQRICGLAGIRECSAQYEFETIDSCKCTEDEAGQGVCR
jgi:hypothetical protein